MRRIDEEALVVAVASLTEDRDPDEQKALLAVALRIDKERAKRTVTNPSPTRPHLFTMMETSYLPSSGRRVKPTKQQSWQYTALVERWESG